MWWNPFYETEVSDDGIVIINQLTNQQKFIIRAANALVFMESVFKPLTSEEIDVDKFLKKFPVAVKENINSLIEQLGNIILADKKQQIYYEHLYRVIGKVKEEFPGLDIDRIVAYMENMILRANAVVLYDEEQYSQSMIENVFPFNNVNAVKLQKADVSELNGKISAMDDKDWLIILGNDLSDNLLEVIDKAIREKNRLVFLSQNHLDDDTVYLGPILMPRCTGSIKQFLNHTCLEKTIHVKSDLVEDQSGVKKDILSEYMYDEILKYTIDKYSNYATEYSKLLGTQYQIDYEEQNITRREFIINETWL